jgi:hypothetical protein
MFRIFFMGDVTTKAGRNIVSRMLPELRQEFSPTVVIANAENAAGGFGIDPKTADEIMRAGVDIITTGNHVWKRKEVIPYLDRHSDRIIRPVNYPEGNPGKGFVHWRSKEGVELVVVNLIGRIFMSELVDCPFHAIDSLLTADCSMEQTQGKRLWLVDFHAEATSEKYAMGYFLDGRVSAVLGTHTHVQTADERILPKGTAYISDVGMCGPYDSVIGVKPECVVERFMRGRPVRFDSGQGRGVLCAVVIDVDEESAKAVRIERVQRIEGGEGVGA